MSDETLILTYFIGFTVTSLLIGAFGKRTHPLLSGQTAWLCILWPAGMLVLLHTVLRVVGETIAKRRK